MPGKLQKFLVEFDNPAAVYYADREVNGHVLVVLSEAMQMRGILLNVSGKAFNLWKETKSSPTVDKNGDHTMQTKTESFSDVEVYINMDITLWDKQDGSGEHPFHLPGSYKYPFSFTLPSNCPSSFEGTLGYIRYTCKAVIDKPWKFNHTTKSSFTVLSLLDLSMHPDFQKPRSDERSKTFSLGGCYGKETVSCTVHLPRTGFVPGEIMPVDLQVVTGSSIKVKEVDVSLEEHLEFYAQEQGRASVRTITKRIRTWRHEGMKIPSITSTMLNNRIMKINYFLNINVQLEPNGEHDELTFKIPVVIGDIPLRDAMKELNNNYRTYQKFNSIQPFGPNRQPRSELPLSLANNINNNEMPPPYYQDGVFGQSDIREEGDNEFLMGNLLYTPKYLCYDYTQTVTAKK